MLHGPLGILCNTFLVKGYRGYHGRRGGQGGRGGQRCVGSRGGMVIGVWGEWFGFGVPGDRNYMDKVPLADFHTFELRYTTGDALESESL